MKGTSQVTWPKPGQNDGPKPSANSDQTVEQDAGRSLDRMLDLSRITLLDERVERKVRGYNPYDAQTPRTGSGIGARDPWSGKPKRD